MDLFYACLCTQLPSKGDEEKSSDVPVSSIQCVVWLKRRDKKHPSHGDLILWDMAAKEISRKAACVVALDPPLAEVGDDDLPPLFLRLGKSAKSDVQLEPGASFKLGKRAIELGRLIPAKQISNARFFLSNANKTVVDDPAQWRVAQGTGSTEAADPEQPFNLAASASQEQRERDAEEAAKQLEAGSLASLIAKTAPQAAGPIRRPPILGSSLRRPSSGGPRSFSVPWKDPSKRSSSRTDLKVRRTEPLHNPKAPNSLVLQQPASPFDTVCTVPVVVDPRLSAKLRDHQRLGVSFLYNCVSGCRDPNNLGAILADDMGLGKSFQTIALMYTVLRQGPLGLPLCRRAIIVCPSSLVDNWAQEIAKWLGPGSPDPASKAKLSSTDNIENQSSRSPSPSSSSSSYSSSSSSSSPLSTTSVTLTCVTGGEGKEKAARNIRQFELGSAEVFITSYDQLKIHIDLLEKIPTDLLICDEGHRLKSSGTQVFAALERVTCARRLLLTGTPLQNNLNELHTLIRFVNPNALGSTVVFQSLFLQPIMQGRQKEATSHEKEIGRARGKELTKLTSGFILRRLNSVNERYLPARCDLIVCVSLTDSQKDMYKKLTAESSAKTATGKPGKDALALISSLRKLCTHPVLATKGGMKRKRLDVNESGKLSLLFALLSRCKVERDRCIIVSNFTSTLGLISTFFKERGWTCFSLDGGTAVAKRQEMVNTFNKGESSKAGGVGLNLIGANRLILLDCDWNPANDAQAMARIWRQGQPKKCYIYRFVSTGTIEEVTLQRQMTKLSLAAAVMKKTDDDAVLPGRADDDDSDDEDGGEPVGDEVALSFSTSEVRDLFTLHENTVSRTHDMLLCNCGEGKGNKVASVLRQNVKLDTLQTYCHHANVQSVPDSALAHCPAGLVSFTFTQTRNE